MFMISMTWLEEHPSPGSEGSPTSSSQGQGGFCPSEGSPSRDVPVVRSRLEEAARHEDLEGSYSSRTWREADRPPNANTEQRRRSSSSLRSSIQSFATPTRHSGDRQWQGELCGAAADQWRLEKLHEWEGGICTTYGSKQDVPAVGTARTWRPKAD